LSVFENQDVDVCGAWIGEFEFNETQIISYRRTPEQHNEIVAFANNSQSHTSMPIFLAVPTPTFSLRETTCKVLASLSFHSPIAW
jgi:hypothetical protein